MVNANRDDPKAVTVNHALLGGFGNQSQGFILSNKDIHEPGFSCKQGLIARSVFLLGEWACSNRCLITEQECSGNGAINLSHCKQVHATQ